MSRVKVVHEPGRFVAVVDGEEAFIDYERRDGVLDVLHTFTPAALRGRGVAEALTRAALDYAAAEGILVVPTCSYTARYFARHPELDGLRAR